MRKKSFSSLRIAENTWKQQCGGLLTRKPWVKLLGPRFDLVSDLVLVQLETWKKQIINLPQKENKSFKSHSLSLSLLMPEKTSNPSLESAGGAKQTTVWKL